MQIGPLIGAAAAGGVLGFIIAFVMSKSGKAAVEAQLQEAQQQFEKAKRDAAEQTEAARKSQRDAEQKAKDHASQLEKDLEKEKTAAKKAQAQLQEVEAAKAKAIEEANAHQQQRQQAEGKVKQSQQMATDLKQKTEQLEKQLHSTEHEKATLKQLVDKRTEELKRAQASGGGDPTAALEAFTKAGTSLDGILKVLVDSEGQKAAVLADANGIVVAAAGDQKLKDGIAAMAQLFTTLNTQVKDMVPFMAVKSFSLQDVNSAVIAGRAFKCAGETLALATYGQRQPGDSVLDGALVNLNAVLQ